MPGILTGYLGKVLGDPTEKKLLDALPDLLAAFRLNKSELKLARKATDLTGGIHFHLDQTRHGLPVVGARLSIHVDQKSGRITMMSGNARSDLDLPKSAKIDRDTAEKTAVETVVAGKVMGKSMLVYVISTPDESWHLAYQVEVIGREKVSGQGIHDLVFINALDGSFVARHPQIHHILNRLTYTSNNGPSLPESFQRGENTGPTGDTTLNMTHDNTGIVYNYYQAVFGRDSLDGNGIALVTSVHYLEPAYGPNNALWTGSQLAYGPGDGWQYAAFGLALDVVAHEFTHGVTQHTSNLTYYGESGALNEAMSDIMGAMCEAWADGGVSGSTWQLGEDIHTPSSPGGAIRYMDFPIDDGISRDYYPERYLGAGDSGGVHLNSGIPNLAFKLLVTGGSHPRGMTVATVPGIGSDKAQRIFYHTNTYLAGPSTDFHAFKELTATAASQLYGSSEVYSVRMAWAAVGVGEPPTFLPLGSATASAAVGQTITLTQDAQPQGNIAWTENVIWQPNGQPDILGNKGLGTINYIPHAGPGTYWYQYRVVDTSYNYQDQFISFTVTQPTGDYLIPSAWVSPAARVTYGNSVYISPFGMASAGVAWTENVIWQPNGQPIVLGNLDVNNTYTYVPSAGPGLYWLQFRIVDNNINYVDQWIQFYVYP